MTKEERDSIKERINILSDEIDANEQENNMYLEEITKLYEILDGGVNNV